MKILVSWLRDFIDVATPIDRLADTLAAVGFEVAAIDPPPEGLREAGGPDAVIDFEINANRPDCMSVLGIAREAAVALGIPLRVTVPGDPAVHTPESQEAEGVFPSRSRRRSCARVMPPR